MRPRLRLHVCASLNEPPQGASPGVAMPNDSIWEEWDDAESDKICLVTLRHVCPYMTDWVQKQTLQICWQLSARMDELQTETGRGFHRWKWRLLIFFTFLLRLSRCSADGLVSGAAGRFCTEAGQTVHALVAILADKQTEGLTGTQCHCESCPTPPTAVGVKTHRGYSSPPAFKGEMNRKKAKMLLHRENGRGI